MGSDRTGVRRLKAGIRDLGDHSITAEQDPYRRQSNMYKVQPSPGQATYYSAHQSLCGTMGEIYGCITFESPFQLSR